MIQWNSQQPKLEYEVEVGYMRVTVRGATQEEAILHAREKLCREMPRLWDVIHGLAASRFSVTCVTADG